MDDTLYKIFNVQTFLSDITTLHLITVRDFYGY